MKIHILLVFLIQWSAINVWQQAKGKAIGEENKLVKEQKGKWRKGQNDKGEKGQKGKKKKKRTKGQNYKRMNEQMDGKDKKRKGQGLQKGQYDQRKIMMK